MDKHDSSQMSFNDRIDPIELRLLKSGYSVVCGVDEAGRGPLAGPVIAAAVIFRKCLVIKQCRDSKQVSRSKREELFAEIVKQLEFGIGECSETEIDKMNIRAASLEAMKRAVLNLNARPDILLVDGRDSIPIDIKSLPIIKGDARVACIGAASIIAKVTRDCIMTEYDCEYPGYGFGQHFGYPTLMHRNAIKSLGPCKIHRVSFRGVREYI
jgi:ribonuclease HII